MLVNEKQRRTEMAERLHDMKSLTNYQQVKCDQRRITSPYVAGIFDAEGHIAFRPALCTTIAQKSCPALLRAINKHCNSKGKLHTNYSPFDGIHAYNLLMTIKPYASQKLEQIKLAERIFPLTKINGKKRTPENREEIDFLQREVKRLKHS
jgi:hypothetical protein